MRCKQFKNNVYLDLYNTGFTISFLSKVRAIFTAFQSRIFVNTYMKLLHQVLYPYIKTIKYYKYAHKLVNFIIFYLTFSIDYYTAMCIDVYLCYIHRVSIEGTCPYMKKLQGAYSAKNFHLACWPVQFHQYLCFLKHIHSS